MDRQTSTLPGDMSAEDAFASFSRSTIAMVLTNPRLDDNPIVYVNRAFERMTGYSAEAAVGRNCRFLQGPDTAEENVTLIRDAVREERELSIELLNYRSDGTAFWNGLLIAPIYNDDGELSYFLGIQRQLTEREVVTRHANAQGFLREIQHRVKNHLSMIVGLIRMQAHTATSAHEFATLSRRVESLQMLYEEMSGRDRESGGEDVDLGAYLTRVGNAIAYIDGRPGVRVNINVDAVRVPVEAATRVGLVVSEVMTNAFQHAFEGRASGLVELRMQVLSDRALRIEISDDGIGMGDATWPNEESLGGRIVTGLIEGLAGDLDIQTGERGTRVSLDLPRSDVNADSA